MRNYHPDNERIKRKYFTFMKEARRQNEKSIDAIGKALNRFEVYSKFRDFKSFHFEQAIGFKKHLAKQKNKQTGKILSKATLNSTLQHLKVFFQWLSRETGYISRINYHDAEYFNLSEKEVRVATAKRSKPVPTVQQIKHTIASMPTDSVLENRNRALMAFTLLTGARDSAIASFKLKHVDLDAGSVFQDAREVKTKFSKTFTTIFLPVGNEITTIVNDWVLYLRNELFWGNDDPLFPKTEVKQGKNRTFEPTGIMKEHWKTTSPIRKIFKDAFEAVDLPNFNPHSFRKTLVQLGQKVCRTPEEFKAWSQNIGHEGVLTTFYSYGEVQPERQAEIIIQLGLPRESENQTMNPDAFAKAVAREMKKQAMG